MAGSKAHCSTHATFDNTLLLFLLHLLSCSSSGGHSSAFMIRLVLSLLAMSAVVAVMKWASPGGPAWWAATTMGRPPIPGPQGLPVLGSLLSLWRPSQLAHRRLAAMAAAQGGVPLMAVSLAGTRVVVAGKPEVARQVLTSPAFSDRPGHQAAHQMLFGRALGFAPSGPYWRRLRRVATSHFFSPLRLAAQAPSRLAETSLMLDCLSAAASPSSPTVLLRPFLQHAALNTIMTSAFGSRFSFDSDRDDRPHEATELLSMVQEGFELLGSFNLADHMPALECLDPLNIRQRCSSLVPRVQAFVQKIIDEHRTRRAAGEGRHHDNADASDFVDVLLGLEGEEKLADADIISISWEMIFRGTDTMALLCEWVLAELVLNPRVQDKLRAELDRTVPAGADVAGDADVARMPYLQAVVKETMRVHPVGPLLSWARRAMHDVEVGGHCVPAGTTAMVNMWAITHDPSVWPDPEAFLPERHVASEGGADVDIRGIDLRLAPFGAGRRVCPGRALALSCIHVWIASIVRRFHLSPDPNQPVDLTELLKLSCEMATPLSVKLTDWRQPVMMDRTPCN